MPIVIKEDDHFIVGTLTKELAIENGITKRTCLAPQNAGIRVLPNGVILVGQPNCCMDYLEYCKELRETTELSYSFIEDVVSPFLRKNLEDIEYLLDGDKNTSQAIILKDKCFFIHPDWYIWEVTNEYMDFKSSTVYRYIKGCMQLYDKLPPREKIIQSFENYNKHYCNTSSIVLLDTSKKEIEVIE